jgi:phage/plasmid-associated DNA primase/5S rRNA maturation endonuclease (ribonuclease M5)
LDIARYHNRLVDYLQSKGFKTDPGLVDCFNPSHPHTGKHTPQLSVYYDKDKGKQVFHCFSGSCGIGGDIYEAVNILEGITGLKEQFQFLENFFGNGWQPPPIQPAAAKVKENFTPDPIAQAELEKYLLQNQSAEKEIIKFLNTRAIHSTKGMIKIYPENLLPELIKYIFYWPGLDIVKKEIDTDILKRVGIIHPDKNYFWWKHPGIFFKLGTGYKLHYYSDGKCNKFNTRCCGPFPMPAKIDTSKTVILVEGEMDAASSRAIGLENVFSSGGTNGITAASIEKLLLGAPEIIICFDADDAGRKASGIIPFEIDDKNKENLPKKLIRAGFTGEIKIAELPVDIEERDQDALIIAGKQDILFDAIRNAKKYSLAENGPKKDESPEGKKEAIKWDFLAVKRLQSLLRKITRAMILEKDPGDLQIFISAILKAAKKIESIKSDLEKWGAKKEEIENKNNFTPYELIDLAWKYELSTYIQKTIKTELTPASEFLKKLKVHEPIVPIDYDDLATSLNLSQFIETKGVRSAALMVSDILSGKLIYAENEKNYYFFNGHVWIRETDVTGVIYNIIHSMMYYYLQKLETENLQMEKSVLEEIIFKIEGRRFRVEIMQEFSQLQKDGVFKETVPFDGPTMKETLTLKDGVIDFSGKEIIYRKSQRDEYRRAVLPYTVEEIKNAGKPLNFLKFMQGNFKDEKTLESLMYYLALIPSRNTQFKYGGIFIGETNTGKTTTMEIIRSVYPEMIHILPSEVLVSKGTKQVEGNQATPYISAMEGKGASLSSETGRNLYLNNAMWKLLTGNDPIPARDLYQKSRNFIPTAQIIILSNYLPIFDSHDKATIGRMLIVPFLVEHKRGEQIDIEQFIKETTNERPAIIKLFAEYYIKLKYAFKGAIPLSEECKKYKQSYIDELETDIDKFVKDCIQFDVSDNAFVPVQTVYERYLRYYHFTSDDSGKEALTRQKFTRYFKRDYKLVNYKQKKINGEPILCFFNIKLRPEKETGDPAMDIEPGNTETGTSGAATMPPPEDDPFK